MFPERGSLGTTLSSPQKYGYAIIGVGVLWFGLLFTGMVMHEHEKRSRYRNNSSRRRRRSAK